MLTFLIVLVIIAAVLLVLVVLAQNPKGGGLSSQFGGSGTSQIMGVQRTGDFLEKLTWGLSIAIVVICMSSFIFIPRGEQRQGLTTPAMEKATDQPIMNNNLDDTPLGIEGAEETEMEIESDENGLDGLEGLTDENDEE